MPPSPAHVIHSERPILRDPRAQILSLLSPAHLIAARTSALRRIAHSSGCRLAPPDRPVPVKATRWMPTSSEPAGPPTRWCRFATACVTKFQCWGIDRRRTILPAVLLAPTARCCRAGVAVKMRAARCRTGYQLPVDWPDHSSTTRLACMRVRVCCSDRVSAGGQPQHCRGGVQVQGVRQQRAMAAMLCASTKGLWWYMPRADGISRGLRLVWRAQNQSAPLG